MRRTNAQISYDNYCADVDQYQFFVYDHDQCRIITGYESKFDAKDCIDCDDLNASIYTKRQCANRDIDVDAVITEWKSFNNPYINN